MGNTRPGAVRHSSRQAAHRARGSASLFGPRVTTATPQHGSRASAVTHPHPATALHAWGTLPPPCSNEIDGETVRQRRARGEKKTAKANRKVKEGVWEGKGHWTHLRVATDEEVIEGFVQIQVKMNS